MKTPPLSYTKPRASFCWLCGKQLYQHKICVEMVIDGHPRILHKQCVSDLEIQKIEEYWDSVDGTSTKS